MQPMESKLREILDRFGFAYQSAGAKGPEIDKAIKQLLTLFKSELPEKKLQSKYIGKRHSFIQGYNNALDDMLTKLEDK